MRGNEEGMGLDEIAGDEMREMGKEWDETR